MLKLHNSDIILSQSAINKFEAIKNIANSLIDKKLVEQGYVDGMLSRENQSSTYLGNGIAIPHGTTETRDMVKTTGVAVHHFPQGVDWGEGNKVHVAIGIAAKSDEHLGILKQLTKVLGAEGVEERLRIANSAEDIIALLHGSVQLSADFDTSLVQLEFPAKDMLQMSAVAGGLLQNFGCVQNEFVAELVTKAPTHLGKGVWLIGSNKKVTRTGLSFVSAANEFEYQGKKVSALLAFAACNDAHLSIINKLSNIVASNEQETLLVSSAEQLINLLTGENSVIPQAIEHVNLAVFKIKNAHGLHARPGAMLVNEAKKFESSIQVANLDGDGKAVNAKSLMKVIALGAKHGHRLQFTADGSDAEKAIESIGNAIEAGLGEG